MADRSVLDDLKQARSEIHTQVAKKPDEELPVGAAPVDTPAAAEPAPEEVPPVVPPKQIRIGDHTFDSIEAATEYAEKLESEKLASESYSQGIQDALKSLPQNVTPQTAEAPEENFDQEFYADPKAYMAKLEEKATQKALAAVQQVQTRESLWTQFSMQNPDLASHRDYCEMVLQQNRDVFANIPDIKKGMQLLATKVRSRFQDWAETTRPQTPLSSSGATTVSAGSAAPSVTSAPRKQESLDFAAQIRSMKKRA